MANSLQNFTPQIWSLKVVERINQINVMLPLVNRDWEGEISQAGDTVYVRTYGDVVTGSYVRGQPISYNNLAPTKETLTVNQSKYAAIEVDDLDAAQNDLNALQGYTGRLGVSFSNTIEAFLQGFYSSANSANVVNNSGSAITLSTSNTYSTIVGAGLALDNQNLPQYGRWMMVSPTMKSFLVKDSTYFVRATDLGDEIVTSGLIPDPNEGGEQMRAPTAREASTLGFVGKAGGFDLWMTTASFADANGRYLMFGQDRPISFASQLHTMEALRLETTFATAVRGLMLYGGQVFAENAKKLGYLQIASTQ